MRLSVGTSGFSYAAWKGPFYPADLPAAGMLAYYAERLPAVEINNTFYRLPRRSVLEGWAAQVPERERPAQLLGERPVRVEPGDPREQGFAFAHPLPGERRAELRFEQVRGATMLTFIHAADIHLDSPLRGLEQYDGAPVEQIRGDRLLMVAHGGRAVALSNTRFEPLRLHEPHHTLATDEYQLLSKVLEDSRTPVRGTAALERRTDQDGQPSIVSRALRLRPHSPRIEAAGRHAQDTTLLPDRDRLLRCNRLELQA